MNLDNIRQACGKLAWNQHDRLDSLLASMPPSPEKEIRTIAVFCESIRMGGVGRVVSLLTSLLHDAGYGIVIFTDEAVSAFADTFHPEVKIEILPKGISERLKAITDAVERYGIDFCIFNDHQVQETFFLIKFARLLGLKTCVVVHAFFFYPLYDGKFSLFRERFEVFRHCDAVVCLSPSDKKWWAAFGIPHAAFIPNPQTFSGKMIRTAATGKQVLFIGRLGREKGVVELPQIILETVSLEPEAQFILLGNFERRSDRRRFWREVKRFDLGKHIRFMGFVDDVTEYLSTASAVILPSQNESFSMVRMEAASYGIPVVMFSMPYLEPAPDKSGAVMVGKRDVTGMAREVARLLSDREYWETLSKQGLKSQESTGNDNTILLWKKLIAAVQNNSVSETFSSAVQSDLDFVRMTVEECVAIAEVNMNRYARYKYLQPIDKVVSWLFPDGSARRDWIADRWKAWRNKN